MKLKADLFAAFQYKDTERLVEKYLFITHGTTGSGPWPGANMGSGAHGSPHHGRDDPSVQQSMSEFTPRIKVFTNELHLLCWVITNE